MKLVRCKGCGQEFVVSEANPPSEAEKEGLCVQCKAKGNHKHEWQTFREKGCTDDRTYQVCECGAVKQN